MQPAVLASCTGCILTVKIYIWPYFQEVIKEVVFGDRDPTFEARRLKEYTSYEFWVTASTRVGEGQPSAKVTQSPVLRGDLNTYFLAQKRSEKKEFSWKNEGIY